MANTEPVSINYLEVIMKIQSKFVLMSICCVLGVSGCASGAKLSEAKIATAPPGMSRIAVYRTGIMGAAIQPVVSVDGKQTGKCQPNGVFFVDVKPGMHRVTATTESTAEVQVNTVDNPVSYVECSIGIGWVVGRPKLVGVTSETGEAVIGDLVLTGSY